MKETITKSIEWFKNNKLTSFLILAVLYLLLGNMNGPIGYDEYDMPMAGGGLMMAEPMMETSMVRNSKMMAPAYDQASPDLSITDRIVVTNSNMSLQVKSVRDTIEIIKASAEELGGYVINRNISTPEFGEDGTISIRIPSDKVDEALKRFRTLAVKVVSETISGTDVTDQYMDIDERLTTLEKNKARLEVIMAEAEEIEDILNVQRQIFNLQSQIDSLKGQQQYLETTSSSSLISVYLSTDELGLPYTPTDAWRPQAVFKQATRDMLYTLSEIGSAGIWGVVYAPLFIVGFVVLKIILKLFKKKQ